MSVIEVQQAETFDGMEARAVAKIRAENPNALLVDLGCGQVTLPEGFIGVDKFATGDRIMQADLYAAPWPFEDGSVDMFTSSHFVEHVPDWKLHFEEVYRCLKPGGLYRFVGPYAKSDRFLQDPSHRQPLTEARLAYFSREWLMVNGLEHSGDYARVNFSWSVAFAYHEDFADKSEAAQEFARNHYWNAVDDIAVLLRKEPL
jgi:predicted SAM-dependent methyltransferase